MSADVVAPVVPFEKDRTLPCRQADVSPEWWFAESTDHAGIVEAKNRCEKCPRRGECLRRALERDEKFGIFGGYTAAERENLVRKAKARGPRPLPPGRYGDPGVARKGCRTDLVNLRRLFAAARACVYGKETRRAAAARLGVNVGHMSEIAVLVEWGPDVADDVEQGRMPVTPAVRYAKAVRAWTAQQEEAA